MRLRPVCALLLLNAVTVWAVPEVVVRVGDDSPLGRPFSAFNDPVIDDLGRVGFVGSTAGLFRRTGATIDGLLVAGNPLAPGRTLASLGPAEIGPPGCIAFVASFINGERGVVRVCDGATTIELSAGDLAPGNVPIASFGSTVGYGTNGELAIVAGLADGTTVLLLKVGAALLEIARTGTPAPTGGLFAGFRAIGVSAAGDVGFSATVQLGPDGVFLWRAGTQQVSQVAVVNSPSPGSGSFSRLGNATMNGAAQFTFRATTTQSGGGIFRVDAGSAAGPITVLALEGLRAPVTEADGKKTATFRGFPTSVTPSINASGQVAFRALLSNSQFNAGVFIAAADGSLARSVIAGQSAAIVLSRLRDPEISDDGSLLLPAAEPGAGSGLYVVRDGSPSEWLPTGALTSVGTGYRFLSGRGRDRAEDAIALGQREGVFLASATGVAKLASLEDPTPLRGTYTGFDSLAGGPDGIAFHCTIDTGRSAEAIFRSDPSGLRTVSRTDRRVPGGKIVSFFGGLIESVVPLQWEGEGILFQALLQRGRADSGIFSAGRRGGVRSLGRQGQRVDRGRLTAFGSFDAGAKGVAAFAVTRTGAASPAVILRSGRQVRTLAASGADTATRALGKFAGFDSVDIGGAGIAFRATLRDPVSEGLFVADKRNVGAVVVAQDAAPGGGRFVSLGPPAVTSSGVLFVAGVAEGASATGIFHAVLDGVPTPDQVPTVTAVLRAGDLLPDGVVVRIGGPRANTAGAAVAAVDLNGGTTTAALYRFPAPVP